METGFGLIRFREAADLVGLSENTLRRYTSQRKIPFIKVGRLVFFEKNSLRKWVMDKAVEPISRGQ